MAPVQVEIEMAAFIAIGVVAVFGSKEYKKYREAREKLWA
jgi:hypothetical protein